MFDIRAIRDNPDAFRAAFERKQKGLGDVVSYMLDHDAAVRKAVSDKQEAEAARNAKSKEIGKAKASGDEALFEQLRKEVADAKDVIEAAGEQEAAARAELDKLLYGTPNIPLPDVPEGEDEDGNVEQHKWGEPNALLGGRNNVQDHADLGAGLKNAIDQPLMDFEAAAAMSGARFVALRGQLARLERALASFMLDKQTLENGYEETNPPLLVREEALIAIAFRLKVGIAETIWGRKPPPDWSPLVEQATSPDVAVLSNFTLARGTAPGKAAGLTFHFSPKEISPAGRPQALTIPRSLFQVWLNADGRALFGGELSP